MNMATDRFVSAPATGEQESRVEKDLRNVTHVMPKEEFRALVEDAEELLKATSDRTEEGYASVRARLENSLNAVKTALEKAETAVVGKTREAAKVTDRYVRDNPWKTLGLGVAVGVVIGLLIGRR